jgi:hypothetical protein
MFIFVGLMIVVALLNGDGTFARLSKLCVVCFVDTYFLRNFILDGEGK